MSITIMPPTGGNYNYILFSLSSTYADSGY